jgi:hypothetical protein
VVWLPVLMLLVGATTFWAIYMGDARHRLDRAEADAVRLGLPLTYDELVPKLRVPDDQNRQVAFARAISKLDKSTEAAKAFKRLDDELDGMLAGMGHTPNETELKVLQAWVEQNQPVLDALDAATKLPHSQAPLPAKQLVWQLHFPGSNSFYDIAELRATAAVFAFHKGDHAKALKLLHQTLLDVKDFSDSPALTALLTSLACNRAAIDRLRVLAPSLKIGIAPGQASPDAVRQVIAALTNHEWIDRGLRESFKSESAGTLDTFDLLLSKALNPPTDRLQHTSNRSTLFSLPVRPLFVDNKAWALERVVRGLNYTRVETIPEIYELPPLRKREPSWIPEIPNRYMMAQLLVPDYDKAAESAIRRKLERELVATQLAVRLYQFENVDPLPPTLAALVPNYLPRVPTDRWDGQPIRYSATTKRIWSIGEDGVDNGGVARREVERPGMAERDIRQRIDDVIELTPTPRPTHNR